MSNFKRAISDTNGNTHETSKAPGHSQPPEILAAKSQFRPVLGLIYFERPARKRKRNIDEPLDERRPEVGVQNFDSKEAGALSRTNEATTVVFPNIATSAQYGLEDELNVTISPINKSPGIVTIPGPRNEDSSFHSPRNPSDVAQTDQKTAVKSMKGGYVGVAEGNLPSREGQPVLPPKLTGVPSQELEFELDNDSPTSRAKFPANETSKSTAEVRRTVDAAGDSYGWVVALSVSVAIIAIALTIWVARRKGKLKSLDKYFQPAKAGEEQEKGFTKDEPRMEKAPATTQLRNCQFSEDDDDIEEMLVSPKTRANTMGGVRDKTNSFSSNTAVLGENPMVETKSKNILKHRAEASRLSVTNLSKLFTISSAKDTQTNSSKKPAPPIPGQFNLKSSFGLKSVPKIAAFSAKDLNESHKSAKKTQKLPSTLEAVSVEDSLIGMYRSSIQSPPNLFSSSPIHQSPRRGTLVEAQEQIQTVELKNIRTDSIQIDY